MRRNDSAIIWGVVLIAAGLLFLLDTFNVIGSAWEWLWCFVFAGGGLVFGWAFATRPSERWWALIPSFTLFGLAILIGLASIGFGRNETEGGVLGAIFLGSIGASFLAIFLLKPGFWWALIPAGVLFTIAIVALTANWVRPEVSGAILFFGLALTFAGLSLMPTQHGRLVWALIPAGVLAIMGVALLLTFTSAVNYIWSIALILAGIYLLYRQWGGGDRMARHR